MTLASERDLLSLLTVVIMTRNRPAELNALVAYWSKWPVSIVVLDGSEASATDEILKLDNGTITVLREPSIFARCSRAASCVKTSYAALHSDDDFLLARSAARAIAWLQRHDDYSSVFGDTMSFTSQGLFAPGTRGKIVNESDPQQRLMRHIEDYTWSYVYGIHRAAEFGTILDSVGAAGSCRLFQENPSLEVGGEFAFEIAGSLLGRLGTTREVLFLKQVGNSGVSDTLQQRWPDWLRDPQAAMALSSWRAVLSDHLAPHIGETPAVTDAWITEALARMLDFDPWARQKDRGTGFLSRIRNLYAYRIPRNPDSDFVTKQGWQGHLQRLHKWGFRRARRISRRVRTSLGLSYDPPADERASQWFTSDTSWGDPLDIHDVQCSLRNR